MPKPAPPVATTVDGLRALDPAGTFQIRQRGDRGTSSALTVALP